MQTRTNQVGFTPAELPPCWGSGASDPDFEMLYRRYRGDLVRYASRQGAEDPEGVADLALLDLARAIDRLRSTDEPVLRAYLYTATRNRASRDRACTDDLHLDEIDNLPSIGFEETVARRLDLDELLSKLSPNQEKSLRLRFFQQLTSAETAAVMEIDAATVRTHQRRGLIRLRQMVVATVVVAIVIVGLVAALRSIGSSAVSNEPIAPVEVPEAEGRSPEPNEPTPAERPDQVGPSVVDRFGSDPTAPSNPISARTATTPVPEFTDSPQSDPFVPIAPTTSAAIIPVFPAPDATAPTTQITTSPTVPVLPPADGPLTTAPILPAPTTTSTTQATTSPVVPVLPPAPAPTTTEPQSTPSSSDIPVLPAPEVPILPAPDVPVLPAPDVPTLPAPDVPVLPPAEQPTSATVPILPPPP